MEIRNRTPFPAAWLVLLDKQAAEQLVLVYKATYSVSESGALRVADEPDPIRPVDEFRGEPGCSSIRHEAELGPAKPSTDVVLLGSAISPRKGAREMEVSFRVGSLSARAKVYGPRRGMSVLGSKGMTPPEPFDSVPLIWENAFGGTDTSTSDPKHHDREPRNPVGCGFRAKHSELKWDGEPMPCLEDPGQSFKKPGQRVPPSGFGFIGRDWEPRVAYAGTYDQKWQEERMPLLPPDFDERFHNAAPAPLVAPGYLPGGERVEVIGCTRAPLAFELPRLSPTATVRLRSRETEVPLHLNTVVVDTETMQARLLYKGTMRIHRELPQLLWMEFRAPGITS